MTRKLILSERPDVQAKTFTFAVTDKLLTSANSPIDEMLEYEAKRANIPDGIVPTWSQDNFLAHTRVYVWRWWEVSL